MHHASEDNLLGPGTWRLWKPGTSPVVYFSCPDCSIIIMIDGVVDKNGLVSELVQCQNLKCAWKGPVTLVGWKS